MTAINILLEEHKLLLKAVETARNIQKIPDNEVYYTQIRGIILFFRNFTEIYHHPKEDDMLYPMLRNRSQVISSEFLYEVCDNHDDFKSMIADIEDSYLFYHYDELRNATNIYINALEKHINKEDGIVLSIAHTLLDEKELETVLHEFQDHDERYGYKDDLIKDFLKIESLNEAYLIKNYEA